MGSHEPLWDQPDLAGGKDRTGYLLEANDGRRETIGCHILSGEPLQILRLPHPTFVPLAAAAFTGVTFLGVLISIYTVSLIGLGLTLAAFSYWVWHPADSGVVRDAGNNLRLPVNIVSSGSHMHVGLIAGLLIIKAMYVSLLYGYLYLWTANDQFATNLRAPDERMHLLILVAFATGALAQGLSDRSMRRRTSPAFSKPSVSVTVWVALAAVAHAIAMAVTVSVMLRILPQSSAHEAVIWMILLFLAGLAFVLFYWSAFILVRLLTGQIHHGAGLPMMLSATFARASLAMAVAGIALIVIAPRFLSLGET